MRRRRAVPRDDQARSPVDRERGDSTRIAERGDPDERALITEGLDLLPLTDSRKKPNGARANFATAMHAKPPPRAIGRARHEAAHVARSVCRDSLRRSGNDDARRGEQPPRRDIGRVVLREPEQEQERGATDRPAASRMAQGCLRRGSGRPVSREGGPPRPTVAPTQGPHKRPCPPLGCRHDGAERAGTWRSFWSRDAIENEGVEYVFGLPGEENLSVIDALADSSIRFVTTRRRARGRVHGRTPTAR